MSGNGSGGGGGNFFPSYQPSSSNSGPMTGGLDYSQPSQSMVPSWGQQNSMPSWLSQLTAPSGGMNFQPPMQTGGNMNVQSQQLPPPQLQQPTQQPMQPLRSSDPNVQQYLNQNYMPGIHGGPDPSMLAGSMPNQAQAQPQPKGVVIMEGQNSPLSRNLTGPPGTTNGPGGLGFATPGQPTQLFGPTAGLFAGATRPPDTPNNFGYYPGTQQWGAPNMGWASQWGKQPGT